MAKNSDEKIAVGMIAGGFLMLSRALKKRAAAPFKPKPPSRNPFTFLKKKEKPLPWWKRPRK